MCPAKAALIGRLFGEARSGCQILCSEVYMDVSKQGSWKESEGLWQFLYSELHPD